MGDHHNHLSRRQAINDSNSVIIPDEWLEEENDDSLSYPVTNFKFERIYKGEPIYFTIYNHRLYIEGYSEDIELKDFGQKTPKKVDITKNHLEEGYEYFYGENK